MSIEMGGPVEHVVDFEPEKTAHSEDAHYTRKIHVLLHHLHDHKALAVRKFALLIYMFLIVIYFAVCATLLGANCQEQSVIEATYYLPFHMVEFWGAFIFAVLEAFILVTIEVLSLADNKLAGLLVGLNVVAAFVAALLFSFSPQLYEVPAHYIEYSVQITLTGANFIFIFVLPMATKDNPMWKMWARFRVAEVVVVAVLLLCAILKLLFYTSVIPVGMGPERASHFFEFTGEMANSVFAFAFSFILYLDLTLRQREHDEKMKHE
jgi:hypothetical protein